MLVSFLISSQAKDDLLFKTILSLKKQTNDDFEVIIFNDEASSASGSEHNTFLSDIFVENNRITLVNNSKFQGHSFNWNLGIDIAKGDYIAILKEGDIVEPIYVESINHILTESVDTKVDIIQVQKELTGLISKEHLQYLDEDKLFNLPEDKEVFAYVQQSIYGKLFRTQYLKDFRLKFRTSVRYDALFVYKALGHARTLYISSAVLQVHKISVLRYSAFDLANQWPHILNYYRRIGIYKDLRDELNYAYFYNLNFNFLLLVKHFQNPQLYKKAIKFTDTKLTHRLDNFINKNKIFNLKKDEEFTNMILNFSNFIKNEWKTAK